MSTITQLETKTLSYYKQFIPPQEKDSFEKLCIENSGSCLTSDEEDQLNKQMVKVNTFQVAKTKSKIIQDPKKLSEELKRLIDSSSEIMPLFRHIPIAVAYIVSNCNQVQETKDADHVAKVNTVYKMVKTHSKPIFGMFMTNVGTKFHQIEHELLEQRSALVQLDQEFLEERRRVDGLTKDNSKLNQRIGSLEEEIVSLRRQRHLLVLRELLTKFEEQHIRLCFPPDHRLFEKGSLKNTIYELILFKKWRCLASIWNQVKMYNPRQKTSITTEEAASLVKALQLIKRDAPGNLKDWCFSILPFVDKEDMNFIAHPPINSQRVLDAIEYLKKEPRPEEPSRTDKEGFKKHNNEFGQEQALYERRKAEYNFLQQQVEFLSRIPVPQKEEQQEDGYHHLPGDEDLSDY